jgi:hypothetical protein
MRFAIKIGLVVTVLLIAGAATLILLPERRVIDDVYARICVEVTKKRLLRPSSMEVIEATVSSRNFSLYEALATIDPSFKNDRIKSDNSTMHDGFVRIITKSYMENTPYIESRSFIEYSAVNKLGEIQRDIASCTFLERPVFSNQRRLQKIDLSGTEITRNDLDWTRNLDVANIGFADTVEIGFADRIRYLLDRTLTD